MRDKGTKENLLKKMRPRRFRLFKLICVCSLVIFHKWNLQDYRKKPSELLENRFLPPGLRMSPNHLRKHVLE
jgi:hypothetical protein